MGIAIEALSQEVQDTLGIKVGMPVTRLAQRHLALAKVMKALNNLEEEDVMWVFRRALTARQQAGMIVEDTKSAEPPAKLILLLTAEMFDTTSQEIIGRRRTYEVAQARKAAIYIMRVSTSASLSKVGEAVGGRSPATVTYDFQSMANQLLKDKVLASKINRIKSLL